MSPGEFSYPGASKFRASGHNIQIESNRITKVESYIYIKNIQMLFKCLYLHLKKKTNNNDNNNEIYYADDSSHDEKSHCMAKPTTSS
jgi:hypothetical protein